MKKINTARKKARLVSESTPFAIRESFNQLRINIMYSPHDSEGAPVYAITSAEQGVGKSTVSANVALSFSQAGQKVLLIDADMRCPTQYKFFGYEKKQSGFSELLSGIAKESSAAVSVYSDNLHIITSGCIPPNPSALLMSGKLSTLVEQWKNEYDIIFIDLPPVGIVSDPIVIAGLVDGYILVARANVSNSKHVNTAIRSLKNVGAKITGLVINGTSYKGSENKKYARGKYSYKYGYTYEYGNKDD
ncbi:MAG: CpsD/CapB family tyrosine-protein kinase [Ruminococcaceae bacterium]|nr:CpsD/CapB family tyrosine-protein kinase [Oscillospiraceae bacterium]